MKKYEVYCRFDSVSWTSIIEADYLTLSNAGCYHFFNSKTKEEWYYPVKCTVVTYKPE